MSHFHHCFKVIFGLCQGTAFDIRTYKVFQELERMEVLLHQHPECSPLDSPLSSAST